MKYFGEYVASARNGKGWVVKDLLNTISRDHKIIVSPAYISKIETCVEIPSIPVMLALCKTLGLDIKEMVQIAKEEEIIQFRIRQAQRYSRFDRL